MVPLHAEGQALTVLRQAGFDARSVGNEMPDTMQGHVARGHAHVGIVVPSAQAAKAEPAKKGAAWFDPKSGRVKRRG